jgi:hypothetical protein
MHCIPVLQEQASLRVSGASVNLAVYHFRDGNLPPAPNVDMSNRVQRFSRELLPLNGDRTLLKLQSPVL